MRAAALAIVGLAVSACSEAAPTGSVPGPARTSTAPTPAATMATTASTKPAGTRIVIADSDFGPIVWGPRRQAVYVFELDGPGRSRCYGECARLWPPVYTKGRPVAAKGARQALLGTTKRRDGRRQVTYAGRPLYFYAHEGPGEVRCHNVFLNGGLWWVVDAAGVPRP